MASAPVAFALPLLPDLPGNGSSTCAGVVRACALSPPWGVLGRFTGRFWVQHLRGWGAASAGVPAAFAGGRFCGGAAFAGVSSRPCTPIRKYTVALPVRMSRRINPRFSISQIACCTVRSESDVSMQRRFIEGQQRKSSPALSAMERSTIFCEDGMACFHAHMVASVLIAHHRISTPSKGMSLFLKYVWSKNRKNSSVLLKPS